MMKQLGNLGVAHVAAVAAGIVVSSSTLVMGLNGLALAGPASLVSALIGFGINLIGVMAFAELVAMIPKASQLSAYTERAVGNRTLASSVGLLYWIVILFATSGEMASGGFVLRALFGSGPVWVWIVALAAVAFIPVLLGLRVAVEVEFALVITLVSLRAGLGLIALTGLSRAGTYEWGGWTPFMPGGIESLIGTVVLGVWLFIGAEFACPLAERMKNPGSTLPRGILLGLGVVLVMDSVLRVGLMGAVADRSLLAGDFPQLQLGTILLGKPGYALMAGSSLLGTITTLLAAFVIAPQMLASLAERGAVPAVFAPRGDEAPAAANWATFLAWSLVGAAASSVLLLITASAFLWLLLYAWAMVLVVILRVRAPSAERPFRMPALPILAPIGIVTILWTDWTVLVSMPASAGLALVFLGVAFLTPLLLRSALPVVESPEAP